VRVIRTPPYMQMKNVPETNTRYNKTISVALLKIGSEQPRRLVLTQHLAVTEVFVLVYRHSVSLGSDIEYHFGFLAIFVHGSFVVGEGSLSMLGLVVDIEELAKTLNSDATKDTKDVALVFVELYMDVSCNIEGKLGKDSPGGASRQ
jgi:hypothetical protein